MHPCNQPRQPITDFLAHVTILRAHYEHLMFNFSIPLPETEQRFSVAALSGEVSGGSNVTGKMEEAKQGGGFLSNFTKFFP